MGQAPNPTNIDFGIIRQRFCVCSADFPFTWNWSVEVNFPNYGVLFHLQNQGYLNYSLTLFILLLLRVWGGFDKFWDDYFCCYRLRMSPQSFQNCMLNTCVLLLILQAMCWVVQWSVGHFLYFVTLFGLPLNLGARELALVTSFIFCIFSPFLKISKCYLSEMSF